MRRRRRLAKYRQTQLMENGTGYHFVHSLENDTRKTETTDPTRHLRSHSTDGEVCIIGAIARIMQPPTTHNQHSCSCCNKPIFDPYRRHEQRLCKYSRFHICTSNSRIAVVLPIILAVLVAFSPKLALASSNPMELNGGSCMAMAGKGCVALAVDRRFGLEGQLVSQDAKRVLKVGACDNILWIPPAPHRSNSSNSTIDLLIIVSYMQFH